MPAHLATIEIVVADMARALDFYRHLGFDLPDGAAGEPHVEVALDGGLKVAFDTEDTIRSFDPAWVRPEKGHGLALAFACDDPADVDATFGLLLTVGGAAHLEPWDAFWGMRYAVVHDPDGNPVDLFASLPAS
jgi:catechol 2,3-dioxygenase-like lactoylglutathione lyase family enzyme